MLWTSDEKELLKQAATIPLRLIYDNIPKENLALFLPYVVIPTGRSNRPHTCFLLTPEDLNIEDNEEKNKIWPPEFVEKNASFIQESHDHGRPYILGSEKARIYIEIEQHNDSLTNGEGPIHIEIYNKTYGQLKSSGNAEYEGVDHLYPMAIFCKQKNGLCFLVVSADYTRSPYGDFKAIRWKEQLKAISSAKFWTLVSPELCDVDVLQWRELRKDAVNKLKNIGFGAHHMLGGLERSFKKEYESDYVFNNLMQLPSWKNFIQVYDYQRSVDGAIRNWKKPPIRAMLETAETDLGSLDLEDLVNCFSEDPDHHGKISVINNISKKYGYMWFNVTALFKGIYLFKENSDVEIQISLSIGNTDTFKGAVIKIYQLGDIQQPNQITKTSRHHYNEDFPCPRGESEIRTLGNAFRYFFYAGVKYVIYRGFDTSIGNYLQSIIKLKDETTFERIIKNLPSNGMVDATLCLFIPAEENTNYRYRNDDFNVWLVEEEFTIDTVGLSRQISL